MFAKSGYKFDERLLLNLIKRAETHYTCRRGPRPSGALLVNDVYDGAKQCVYGDVIPPFNSPSCIEVVGCMMEDGHCVRNNHAEVDALLKAARYGHPTNGGTMYSINKPCYNCTKAIIAAGIVRIVYAYAVYDEERTQAIIDAAGIEVIHVEL